MMHAAFGLAAAVTKLKSLAFDKGQATATPAFRALYDTCAEVPALNFLINPQGKWLGRIGAVAAFALPMGQAVRAEVLERRGGSPRAAGDGAASSEASAAAPSHVPSAAFMAQVRGEASPAAA